MLFKAVSPVLSLPQKIVNKLESLEQDSPSLGYVHVVFEWLLAKDGGCYLVSYESPGSLL